MRYDENVASRPSWLLAPAPSLHDAAAVANVILLVTLAFADAGSAWEQASAALAAGDLPAAEAAYREVLSEGHVGGDAYYNLGNVLYRQERIPEAILAWRRAAWLLPRDPDVEANLDFGRRKVKEHLEAEDPVPWFAPWQVGFSPAETIWFGAATAGIGLLLLAGRSRSPALLPAGASLGILGLVIASGGYAERALPPAAVVLVDELRVTSDLGGGVDLFVLHGGAEVLTVESAAGRTLVRLPDDRKGWVPSDALGLIDPEAPFPGKSGTPTP